MALNDNYTGIYNIYLEFLIKKIKVKNVLVFSLFATITDTKWVKIDKLRN